MDQQEVRQQKNRFNHGGRKMKLSDYKGKLVLLRSALAKAKLFGTKRLIMRETIETVRIIRKIENKVLTVKGKL